MPVLVVAMAMAATVALFVVFLGVVVETVPVARAMVIVCAVTGLAVPCISTGMGAVRLLGHAFAHGGTCCATHPGPHHRAGAPTDRLAYGGPAGPADSPTNHRTATP